MAAGLLTLVSEAGTRLSSCSSSPGLAAPWRGQGGLCCPARAGPGALLCSAGAEPLRKEKSDGTWPSLFSSAPGAGAEMACCLSHYWKVAVVY